MDYKETLLLPSTSFAMRANLAELEPQRFKKWFEQNYAYEKMKENRKNAKKVLPYTMAPLMLTDISI